MSLLYKLEKQVSPITSYQLYTWHSLWRVRKTTDSLGSILISSSSSLFYFLLEFHLYCCWLSWVGRSMHFETKQNKGIYIHSFPAFFSASKGVHVHNDKWLYKSNTTYTYHLLILSPGLVIVLPTLFKIVQQKTEK